MLGLQSDMRQEFVKEGAGLLGTPLEISDVRYAECQNLLSSTVLRSGFAAPAVIGFVGAQTGSLGSAEVAAATAQVLAESVNGQVCLVDLNFRCPSIGNLFSIPEAHGVTGALKGVNEFCTYELPSRNRNLHVIPAGSDASSAHLATDRLEELRVLRRKYPFVLVSAPDAYFRLEISNLATVLDGFVLVLEAGKTRRRVALRAMEDLKHTGVPVLGAVLNQRTYPIPSFLYDIL